VNDQGRIVLPAEVRKELGIKPGDRLILRVTNGRIGLSVPRPIRGAFKHLGGSMVDELLADRRAEVEREMREL
jgi:AbrB family looped-hinge helix DNA binding protein